MPNSTRDNFLLENMTLLSKQRVHVFVGCLTSQKYASVSQGRICTDNFTCCHPEIEVAHQSFYFTQSQYTDTGPTSPSADPTMPGVWQGSHWSANFLSHWYDLTQKKSCASGIRTQDLPLKRWGKNKQTRASCQQGGKEQTLHYSLQTSPFFHESGEKLCSRSSQSTLSLGTGGRPSKDDSARHRIGAGDTRQQAKPNTEMIEEKVQK